MKEPTKAGARRDAENRTAAMDATQRFDGPPGVGQHEVLVPSFGSKVLRTIQNLYLRVLNRFVLGRILKWHEGRKGHMCSIEPGLPDFLKFHSRFSIRLRQTP